MSLQASMTTPAAPIAAAHSRYIKLGSGGCWAPASLEQGLLAFGYHSIPHDICLAKDWGQVRALLGGRKSAGAQTAGVTEVQEFYEMDEDCLWITFAGGPLWWAFSKPEVIWNWDGADGPSRVRKARGGWSKYDIHGRPLHVGSLSSNLTKTANYRATICQVEAHDYLLRRINGVREPVVLEAFRA